MDQSVNISNQVALGILKAFAVIAVLAIAAGLIYYKVSQNLPGNFTH